MIRIGTSGYSFPDWKGQFYPKDMQSSDMLRFYSNFYQTVELSSTHFQIPSKEMFENMLKKVPENFKFSVKAHRSITQEKDLSSLSNFMEALTPLIKAGKLACILFQFPRGFFPSLENQKFIKELKDRIPVEMVVDFRNPDWVKPETIEATFRFLEQNNIGYCSIDEPKGASFTPSIPRVSSKIGYIRFHGRNSENWFQRSEERFRYNYSKEELQEWVNKIKAMESVCDELYIFFHNYQSARAIFDAKELHELLELGKIELPEGIETELSKFMDDK